MVDESERIRKFLNLQYVKMKHLAAVGSLILLAVNLSFTVYPYIEFRFPSFVFGVIPRAWIGVPVIFFLIIILIWFAAHIYIRKMEMYRTEQRAEMVYNPYQVYAFQPFQEMQYRNITIPILKGIHDLLPDGEQKDEIKQKMAQFNKWLKLGYIPKEDFPDHLKEFYITKKERRL